MKPPLTDNGNGPMIDHPGGCSSFYAIGDFGGGSLELFFLPPAQDPAVDGNWIDTGAALTDAKRTINVTQSRGTFRWTLSGATSPSLAADIDRIPLWMP